MRLWTVFEPRTPANAGERADRTIFVKDGFSWPGLAFSLPWLLFHRLWLGTFVFIVLSVTAGLIGHFLPLTESARMLLGLLANLFVGFEGNDMRRRKLLKQGFVQAGSVLARNRHEAEEIFFAARGTPAVTPPAPAPRAATAPASADDALGFFPRPGSVQ
jgi:hypothetical protein